MHHVGWQLMEKRLRLGVWTATPLLVQFAPRRQTCPNMPASCWKIASSNSVGSPRIPAATGTTVAPTVFPLQVIDEWAQTPSTAQAAGVVATAVDGLLGVRIS